MSTRAVIKTVPLSMRLDPDLKAKLKRLAERENRSLTNYIETALRRLTDGEPDDRKRAHARA